MNYLNHCLRHLHHRLHLCHHRRRRSHQNSQCHSVRLLTIHHLHILFNHDYY
jgi:hypothetical protein